MELMATKPIEFKKTEGKNIKLVNHPD